MMKSLLLVLGFLVATQTASLAANTVAPVATSKTTVTKPTVAPKRAWAVDLYLLNPEVRLERDENQQLATRVPMHFGAGLSFEFASVLLEYSSFTEKTGNVTLGIDRSHREMLAWWRQNFARTGIVKYFASLGVGTYSEEVKTTLNSASVTDSTGLQIMGGTGAGLEALFMQHFILGVEGRVLAGKNFDPNPQLGVLARAGVEF